MEFIYMAKVVKVYETNSALAVTMTAGTVELRTLEDFPDQLASLRDSAMSEGTCCPVSLKYKLSKHETDWQQLLRQRNHPDHLPGLADFYISAGISIPEAFSLAHSPNMWYLTHGAGVHLGDVCTGVQKIAFKMKLTAVYTLKAFRLSRKWPITRSAELFGWWQNQHERGIFIIEHNHRYPGSLILPALEVVHPTEFAGLLRERFFEMFPMVDMQFLTKFEFADRATLKDLFPDVEFSVSEHYRSEEPA